MTPPAQPGRRAGALSWLTLLFGAGGFAALWVIVALATNRQCSWMALVGALDIAWMLRLGHWPAGRGRAIAAVLATVAMIVAANWFITASQLGAMLGFDPLESALRLGPQLAWTLAGIANGAVDLAWLAAALVLAAIAGR